MLGLEPAARKPPAMDRELSEVSAALGQLDLSSIVDVMIAGEDDEREAGAFAVAEFVAESDSRQVYFQHFKNQDL